MRKRTIAGGSLMIVGAAMLTMVAVSPAGAASVITNGDFETDAVGASVVTGWTSVLGQVDLGVTSLGGCVGTDGSDYTQLRGYVEAADRPTIDTRAPHPTLGGVYAAVPAGGGAQIQIGGVDLWFDGDGYLLGLPSATTWGEMSYYASWSSADQLAFNTNYPTPDPVAAGDAATGVNFLTTTVQVADESTASSSTPIGRTGKVLELFSDLDADTVEGYVAHGPAVVSDPFTVPAGQSIYLDWMAAGDSDDYHVYGYLLNTVTCAKITVINSTGESHAWGTVEVPVTELGTYRFVFVSGSYDQSWGGAAGALLYIDNVELAQSSNTSPMIPFTGSGSLELLLLGTAAVASGLVLVRRSRLA